MTVPRRWLYAERAARARVVGELTVLGSGAAPGLVEERLAFGAHPAQHALLVRPAEVAPDTPLVLFVHGGSWRHGSPEAYRAVGRFFARHGFVTALAGYRLVPGARFPAQRDDVIEGLSAVVTRARELGIRAEPVALVGHSAGAHLAALAAFDEDARRARGSDGIRIAGLLAVSGPLDFDVLCPSPERCPLIAELMGRPDGWAEADPARVVRGGPALPVLCLHGSKDPLVPPEVAASFVCRANGSTGDHAALVVDPRAYHTDMVRVLLGRSRLSRLALEWLAEVVRD